MSSAASNSKSDSNNNNHGNNNNNVNETEFKIDGELIAQGAEAKIYKSLYDKKMTIVKYRFPKKYRHPQLDLSLRRNRSKNEQRTMSRAKKAGIHVPNIYYYDKNNCAIHMEYIGLPTVKSVIMKYYNKNTKKYDDNKCITMLKEIGKNIGILHKNNLIHGDLTTSNLLINEKNKTEDIDLIENEIIMIDFGLAQGSTKQEDKAVDLYVLERALTSTHTQSEYMIDIILQSYAKHYGDGHKKVVKRLEAVRLRGRKRSMIG